jgi:hypothetical protein
MWTTFATLQAAWPDNFNRISPYRAMTAIEWPLTNWAPLAPSFRFLARLKFQLLNGRRGKATLASFPPCARTASVVPAVAIVDRTRVDAGADSIHCTIRGGLSDQ